MGREIKRVPLDFDHPIDKVWSGYITPPMPDDWSPTIEQMRQYNSDDAVEIWVELHPDVEPPTGDGWQLWETVTEGSPVSPVCASRNDLINWMERNGYAHWATLLMAQDPTLDHLPSAIGTTSAPPSKVPINIFTLLDLLND